MPLTMILLILFSDASEPVFADIDAIADRTSNASGYSYPTDFRDRIIERDGTCVCTNETAAESVSCHIIPHSKGNNVSFNNAPA